jgi:CheY-like chemotaxis protein
MAPKADSGGHERRRMPRILVVHDDATIRGDVKEHLSGSYDVIETRVPETVLAMALERKPNAILLDLSMPRLSGLELCKALSSLSFTQDIPVFVCGQDERNKAFCQRLGASRYFTKPIDFAKLKTDLASALRSKGVERRVDVRVRLTVILKLRVTKKDGTFLEVRVATENVSKGGFLCACASSLEEVVTVEVFSCGEPVHYLGHARLVRVVKTDALNPRYVFQFIGTMGEGNKKSRLESITTMIGSQIAPSSANARRSQRVVARIRVLVQRQTDTNGLMSELGQTVEVNAHGALIALAMKVQPNELLVIKNLNTGQERQSRVVRVSMGEEATEPQVAIEFTEPSPKFWNIDFPPSDWKIATSRTGSTGN